MGRFKKECRHPGCRNLTYNAYCDEHVSSSDNRASAYRRGYNTAWRKYRKVFLTNHPYCVRCEKHGVYVLATVVDHIKPHKGNKDLFWDSNNHQALCERCHNIKTAREDTGSWNTHKGLV